MPAVSSASRTASATATFAAWCRPRRATAVGPRPGSSTRCASRSQSRIGAGSTIVSGTPSRADRRRTTASASPAAPVTATSPRPMIAAFSRAIAVTVVPRRSVWSRPTLVTTATPPSHACVASRRPPRPTSTSATSSSASAKCRNITAVSSSNSVGGPEPRRDPVGQGDHRPDEPRERCGIDRPPVDDDPLPVGHEMRLGRLADAIAGGAERGAGERDDAALAVGAGDERAPDGQLRVAHRPEQRPDPAEAEAHPVPATRLDLGQRLGVREVRGDPRVLSLAAGTHDFVRSSS